MKLILERQIQLAFIFALLLLLVLGFFGYRSASSLQEALKWEKHTQEVLMQLDETFSLAADIESNGRGFALTGDESFLESYGKSEQQIDPDLTGLHRMIADNPKQVAEFENLQTKLAEKSKFNNSIIELRRREGLDAAAKKVATGEGKDNGRCARFD